MTDDAGNTASAATDFDLDTTADLEDDTVLAVSVDSVINDADSGNVTLTLSGVDADASSVTVTLTDGDGTAVTAAAFADNNGDWTVDVSGGALIDGNVSVAVDMTDDAGNTASAGTSFTLDTTADVDKNFAVSVAADDQVTNLAESTDVSLSLSGIDADASSVSVAITDGVNAVTADASYGDNGWVVADQNLDTLDDGTLTVSATVTDQAGNSADVSTTLELDTVVVPPVTLLVSDAHADMTAAEAANAMTVTVEDGSAWTVTLTGTRNDAAQIDQTAKLSARDTAQTDKDTAQSTYDTLSVELSGLQTQLGLEQQGLAELNSALEGLETTASVLEGDVATAQQSYNTGYAEAVTAASAVAPDPDQLVADVSVVEETLIAPDGSTIEAGETWTAESIAVLSALRDSFIAQYTPEGETHTVADLVADVASATGQLSAASANVATAAADRDVQQGVTDAAQGAVSAKQGEVDTASGVLATEVTELAAAQGELDAADAEVAASIVTITGTGTGSAQVVGLDAADLVALGEGAVAVSSVATDPAGNTDNDGTGFTLDTITPDAPSIASWATDTNITDDGITSDNILTLSVTGEPGGTPRLYVDGTHLGGAAEAITPLLFDPEAPGPEKGMVAITSQGDNAGYSWTEDAPGVYTVSTDELEHEFAGDLTVTVTDDAGNESAHSNSVTVAVDTVAPAKPVIDSVVEDTNVTDDGVTFDNTLTLTITGESGASLTLFQDDTEIVPVSVTDNGNDTYTVVTDVISDVTGATLSVTLTDTAGNVSEVSDDYVVTVDTVAPGAPTVLLMNDSHNHADQAGDGSSDSDNLTKFDVLQLELTGEPGGTVAVFDGGTAMADAVVEENVAGVYSVTTVAMADGQHDLSFTVMDTAGNVSPVAQLSVTVDTVAPGTPSIDLVNDTLGDADQGDTATDDITKDNVLTLTVAGEAGGLLILEDNGAELAPQSVTDNDDGTYTVVTGELADGAHALTAKVRDDAGNISDAGTLTVMVDTGAPAVTIDSIGAGGVIQDNESGADHTISGTGELGRLVELAFPTDDDPTVSHTVTTMVQADGSWSYTLNNDDMIMIGQGAGRSVVATQVDVAGNVFSTASSGFEMYTATRIDSSGVLDESQLTANLGHPDTVEGGTVITSVTGTLTGSDDVVDLSGSSSDVQFQAAFGTITVDDGTTVRSAYMDPDGDFETILTGAGDDLLIGLDGVSEVFNPGTGSNTVIAGDTAGTFDELDYSQMSGVSGSLAAVASADVTGGKEYTVGTDWKQSELVVLNLNGQSFAAPTAQYATLAALVVALEQQVEAAAGGDIVSMTTNDVTNTVTATANAGTDQAAVVAALQASDIVAVDIGGIYADLSLSASENVYAAYIAETGKVLRNDGGTDEVFGIEGVLGTAYEDILAGDDLENYLAAGAGDDIVDGEGGSDELFGDEGNDYIYGGDGDDYIVGGAGTDILFGGSGRDVYAVDLGSVDTIRDFGVSAILSSAAGRGGVNDQVEFGFSDADLTSLFGSVPGALGLSLSLTAVSDYQYTLVLTGNGGGTTATLGTVDLNWGTAEALFGDLDPADFDLNAFLPAGGTLATGSGDYSILATLEFVREAQVDDAAGSQVVIGEGTSDDIFVSTQGDDIVIGGLGEDTYETRILGETDATAIDNGTETLNDLGGVGEVDTVFFEGVRDLGDLVFDRVELRREGEDRSLEINYEQYRGIDDEDTVADEVGALHATGTVELFNQFSLSQSDLYAIEGLQIAAETDNPLEAAVQSYVFGEVTESAETGDILSASADQDSILIGTDGKADEYRIEAPTDGAEAWIYGMGDGTSLDANEDVIIGLNGSMVSSMSDVSQVTLAGGDAVQKVSITFDQGGNDAILDLFFADGGNVNSTDLIDRIKFES